MKALLGILILFSLIQQDIFAEAVAPVIVKSVDPASAQADILGILEKISANVDESGEVNTLLHELNSKWDYYLRFKVTFESTFKVEMSKRLIKVYGSIRPDNDGINFANKVRILEFVGPLDNNLELHKFFLREMDTPNKDLQEYVLRSVGGRVGVKGEDIYSKIRELVAQKKLDEVASLRYLKAADEKRAIKEIQNYIRKTDDLEEYLTASQLLCYYWDPELLDVVAARYPDFKRKPRKSFGDNPAFAFTSEMMRKYIEYISGERLVRALEIASDADTFGNEELPLLEKKLHDNTVVGRKAVVGFLLLNAKPGYASKDRVLNILKKAANRERNSDVKKKLHDGIKRLERGE